jgi:Domain of unknown function (DUF4198)
MYPAKKPRFLLTSVALLLAGPLWAHDFWIEPSTFSPTPGQPVVLRLRVGTHFLGDPVARDSQLLKRFVAWSARGEVAVPGLEGRDPAGVLRVFPEDGLIVVGYESRPSLTTMDAETFETFVVEEGLDRRLGPPTIPADGLDDSFSRHVKTLLQRPGQPSDGYDRDFGFELELIPGVNPATLSADSSQVVFPARLVFKGRPAAGVLIQALPRRNPTAVVKATTDAAGKFTLSLFPETWLVKAVVAENLEGAKPNLRSYWAALTFEIPKK